MAPAESEGGAAVSAQGFAVGGDAEVGEDAKALTALALLDDALLESDVGPSDASAFRDACRDADVRANVQSKHARFRGVGGSCGASGLEKLLMLLRARLSPASFPASDAACAKVLARRRLLAADGERFRATADARFGDAVRVALYGDLARHRPAPRRVYQEMDGAYLRALQRRALGNVGEFTFVFVGELPPDGDLGPLLNRYLGARPPPPVPDPRRAPPLAPRWVRGAAPADEPLAGACAALAPGRAPRCSPAPVPVLRVTREAAPDAGPDVDAGSALALIACVSSCSPDGAAAPTAARSLACDVLQRKLLAFLRSSTALVYSVHCDAAAASLSSVVTAQVAAQCAAQNVAAVRDAALGLVRSLADADASDDAPVASWASPYLDDAVLHRAEAHAAKLRHRSYWLFWLLDAYKAVAWRGGSAADAAPLHAAVDTAAAAHSVDYAAVLEATTPRDVRAAAREMFGGARVSAELLPAVAAPPETVLPEVARVAA